MSTQAARRSAWRIHSCALSRACRGRLAHYVAQWGAEHDAGFVADRAGRTLGAAWWTFLPADDPAYGFIDEATPEASIGVVAEARGQGLGTALLDALTGEARRRRCRR